MLKRLLPILLFLLAATAVSAETVLGCATDGSVYDGPALVGSIATSPVVACDNDPVSGRTYFFTPTQFGYWTRPNVTTIVATYPQLRPRRGRRPVVVNAALLCLRANDGCLLIADQRLVWVNKTSGAFIELGKINGLEGSVLDIAGYGGAFAPWEHVVVLTSGGRLYELVTIELKAYPYGQADPATAGLATDCSGQLVTASGGDLASCVRVSR